MECCVYLKLAQFSLFKFQIDNQVTAYILQVAISTLHSRSASQNDMLQKILK